MSDTIATLWNQYQSDADSILEVARECSALSDPVILPPEGHDPTDKLPEAFQSIGAQAVTVMKGRLAASMYPPGQPWYLLDLPAHHKTKLNEQQIIEASRRLMLTEISAQALMETSGLGEVTNRRPAGFNSQKLASIAQLIVTGDTLERIWDDLRVQVFRRDQYVTRRNTAGDVLLHITLEHIDPLALPKAQFDRTDLSYDEISGLTPTKRMRPMYTKVEWMPELRHWDIRQEINGQIITKTTERISPYISTAWRLAPGEHYGRGHVELHLGSLRTLDTLERRRLDILGIMSKAVPVIDAGSMVRPRDLARPSGEPITNGRVIDGKVQDVGFLGFNQIPEHRSLVEGIAQYRQDIKESFLMEAASVRDSERTTALEVHRNAQEINQSLGGIYIPLVEQQHVPTASRVLHVMRKSGKFSSVMPEKFTEIRSLTGLSEIVRNNKAQGLLETTQIASLLGPEALERIDTGALFAAILRYRGIVEPGIVRSEEDVEAMRAQQVQLEQQQAAQQAAINVAQTAGEQLATQAIGAQ